MILHFIFNVLLAFVSLGVGLTIFEEMSSNTVKHPKLMATLFALLTFVVPIALGVIALTA